MKIEISHSCEDFTSYRAERVKSLFNAETGYSWSHMAEIPIEDLSWKIGLIVGPSGSGKTSLGKRIFPAGEIHDLYKSWPDAPIVDAISPTGDFNQVTGSLSAVGLGDVPAWLRPFKVLSNGEQFRAGLARLMCEAPAEVVVDEFTSVIDRQIAKVGAAAFAKSWRRTKGKAVLLSCHYDIIEWLQPDWIYDTKEARFYTRDCLRQRPEINIDIYRVPGTKWNYFKPHYYLDLPYPVAAQYFIGFVDGEPVAHVSVCPMFQSGYYRATRLVVMPEWQGIGVGTAFLNEVCRLHLEGHGRNGHKFPVLFHTSHPQLCHALRKSPLWEQMSGRLIGDDKAKSIKTLGNAAEKKGEKRRSGGFGGHFRAVQGFKYHGGVN